ncbi:TPA: hypothetical protein PPO51_002494 [Clostridioides difficile]|nr:hypothetical protein [Clostridioides difficile]HDJ1470967.1 hypothetical protein [Clostridioides difficile]
MEKKENMYFTYGIGEISKEKFKKPNGVSTQNKIKGGLWCCPKNEFYSEWFVITLACPDLVRDPIPYDIDIYSNANILKLTSENIDFYTDSNRYIDFNKVKSYDVIHFSKDLVENIKQFESYYVESLQILNFDIISYKESYIDENYVLSEDFRKKAMPIVEKMYASLLQTDVFKMIQSKEK